MSTHTRRFGPEAGVSIVEVLIALVVFTVGALAAAQHTLVARQQANAGEIITEAAARRSTRWKRCVRFRPTTSFRLGHGVGISD